MIDAQDTQIPFSAHLQIGTTLVKQQTNQDSETQSDHTHEEHEGWTLKSLRSEVRGTQYWSALRGEQQVELKVVWPNAYSDNPVMWCFEAGLEMEKLSQIKHAGIQEVYEWGYDEAHQCWWVALEDVKGLTLRRIIEENALSAPDARTLFMSLIEGLSVCHEAGLVHRHIDLAHIMLTEAGAKLIRFQWPEEVRAGELAAATALLRSDDFEKRKRGPQYDLLPPEWLDGAEGDALSDAYSLGACLLRAVQPEGASWRDAPPPLQAVIAQAMSLDPSQRGQLSELSKRLQEAASSFLYKGTDDDEPRRLMLHEVVALIRQDEVAWHMLGAPQSDQSLSTETQANDLNETLAPWGSFDQVVEAIARAKKAQPTHGSDRSTQKAIELLDREAALLKREEALKQLLQERSLELKKQTIELKQAQQEAQAREAKLREELEQERQRASQASLEAQRLKREAQSEYQAAKEARDLAGSHLADQDAERQASQAELRESYEQLKQRITRFKAIETTFNEKQAEFNLKKQEQERLTKELEQHKNDLEQKEIELQQSLNEAQQVSAEAKIERTAAIEAKTRAKQFESATQSASERLKIEQETWQKEHSVARQKLHEERELSQQKLKQATEQADQSKYELERAQAERTQSKTLLAEVEKKATQQQQERMRLDSDLERIKQEQHKLERDHNKLLADQRHLIDQTRKLNFREKAIHDQEHELKVEEKRVLELRDTIEARIAKVKAQEERVGKGKAALISERQELEEDRRQLEQEKAKLSGTHLAFIDGRVERGEDGEPLPAGHVNEVKVESYPLRFRYCPPGRLLHGSSGEEAKPEEKPKHLVELTSGYWLSETPVTQALWTVIMGPKEWAKEGDELPADQVSWLEAVRFCNRLSKAFGLSPAYFIESGARPTVQYRAEATGYRLPTEAEWEHAARAGGNHKGLYAGDSNLDEFAWYIKNSEKLPQKVKSKAANAWGLHDLCGNVWEWCHDEWRRDTYRARVKEGEKAVVDPVNYSEQLTPKVIRGGAFYELSVSCRIASRPGQAVDQSYGVGLRLCLPIF